MKLVMTLVVRNEAEMIGANLDYHLAQGVDHVIVTDRGSTDAAPKILSRYAAEGPVTVIREEGEEHHQSSRVTHMAQLALTEHAADWVIHDADEFWWPLVGNLRDVFGSIPEEYGLMVVERRYFIACPADSGPWWARLVYRERPSINPSGWPLEPKVAHRPHPEVVVQPGNHPIDGGDFRRPPILPLVEIFHFPMRDYEQWKRKLVEIRLGYESLPDRSPDLGRDQLKLFEIDRQVGLPKLREESLLVEPALKQVVDVGSIVVDRRLARSMESLTELSGLPSSPERQEARSLVQHLLQTQPRAEDSIVRVEALEAQAEHLMVDLERLVDDEEQLRTKPSRSPSRLIAGRPTAPRVWFACRGTSGDVRHPGGPAGECAGVRRWRHSAGHFLARHWLGDLIAKPWLGDSVAYRRLRDAEALGRAGKSTCRRRFTSEAAEKNSLRSRKVPAAERGGIVGRACTGNLNGGRRPMASTLHRRGTRHPFGRRRRSRASSKAAEAVAESQAHDRRSIGRRASRCGIRPMNSRTAAKVWML